jgi:hypothetical protein
MLPAQKSVARRTIQVVLALVLVATLSACSNGGSQVPTTGSAPPAAPGASAPLVAPTANPPETPCHVYACVWGPSTGAGLWHGKLLRGDDVLDDTTCLVTQTGELSCILLDVPFCCYTQPLRTRDNRPGALHGVLKFEGAGEVLAVGKSVVADFTILGGALSDQNRQLELTIASSGEALTLSAWFDHYYYLSEMLQRDPLGLVSFVYAAFFIKGEPASLTIDDDGALFSQTASGCVLNGLVTAIDPRYNAYALNVSVANCPGMNGAYDGVATLLDFFHGNGANQVLFAAFNSDNFIVGEGVDWLDPQFAGSVRGHGASESSKA